MENLLKNLFDYQRIAGNPELAAMIKDTESRYNKRVELFDDDLAMLNAAGSVDMERVRNKRMNPGEDGTWKQ